MATIAPPLALLTEAVKSIVTLSDIFYEEEQFDWMLTKLCEIQRDHPIEDEIMHSNLIIGICKALSVLGRADQELIDRTKRFLEVGLKSSSISQQTCCIYGLLYLVQPHVLLSRSSQFQTPGNDIAAMFIPLIMDYLRVSLPTSASTNEQHKNQRLVSENYITSLWSITFYVMENFSNSMCSNVMPVPFISWYKDTLHLALAMARQAISSTPSHGLYLTLMAGLQRLVLSDAHDIEATRQGNEHSEYQYCRQQILRLATDTLNETNPVITIPAIKLFLSCIYSDVPNKRTTPMMLDINDKTTDITSPVSDDAENEKKLENSDTFRLSDDPELLMQTMERISIIFDCVRRSDSKVAELLCYDVLPNVLLDFFPAADVINRVINEFISPGQPHQVLLAWVLFAIFKHGAKQDQTSMLQEWVLMALPNFTKRSPISHSIWCLTVFFISAAANNVWLQAMFPYLQQRHGYYQNEDKKLFCVAAKYFYNNLSNPLHKQKFIDTFELVSHPQTPYYDLLKSL